MRLRTTLVGLLVLIAAVLSGTIYAGFTMHKQDVVSQAEGEVERTATVVASRIDTRLGTTVDTVDLWSGTLAVTGTDTIDQLQSLNTFVYRTQFNRASIYAADGTLEAIAGPSLTDDQQGMLVGSNLSGSPFVEAALSGTEYIGSPNRSVTGDDVVRISVPIRDDNGTVVGVFAGSFELATGSLFENVSEVGHPADSVTVFANERELFAQPADAGPSIVENATVERTGWTISVSRPRSTIAGSLGVATAMQIGGVLIGLLAIGVVGAWISRTTLVRIRALLAALTDLESGEYRTDLDLGDIDEWQRISERFNSLSGTLEQRDSQLRVLNRVLRHNLRNDMNVITARAERLLSDEDTPRTVRQDVRKIHQTASRLIDTSEHARTLYDDLLQSPRQVVEPVDVTRVVRERTTDLESQFPDCTIETDLPAQAWAFDAATLPIVVEEVIRNAIIHNDLPEPDRHVTVSVDIAESATDAVDAEHETRITVADNGPGIPMVEEALLTDQIEETPVEHGSGLGVWLVNWLVDRIGGDISVSTGVERGTTVTIHVPAPEDPPVGVGGDGA